MEQGLSILLISVLTSNVKNLKIEPQNFFKNVWGSVKDKYWGSLRQSKKGSTYSI